MGILTDIFHALRPWYDPVADFDNRLPVRQRQTETTAATRTATAQTDTDGLHEGPDGRLYVCETTTDERGAILSEWDSQKDYRTGTNVNPELTDYDLYAFDKLKAEKYDHLKLDNYKLIKRLAFSQAIKSGEELKPISRREAANVPGIKGRRGYSERRIADYYATMNYALYLEQNNTPIPSKEGATL